MLTGPTGNFTLVGPCKRSATGLFYRMTGKKKANRQVGSESMQRLLGVVRVVIFAAVAFGTVAIQVQTVVGQTNAMTCGNFALA